MNAILYYIKFILFYLLSKIRPLVSSATTSGLGKRKVFTTVEKEQVRNLVKDGFSIDASYFNGFDNNGRFLGLGMQKRLDGGCESVFFVRVPEVCSEPLVLNMNPSTWTTHVPDEWRTRDGLHFDMREPMRRWNVTFEGDVVSMDSRRKYKMKFIFEWNRTSPIFDADTDMDSVVISRAIASERWSKQFFNDLKELHQTHYEVFGNLEGTMWVDDLPAMNLTFVSMKDRSYGKHRHWGDFRRYILQYLSTEDGLYIGCHFVSITKTFSNLLVGFVLDGKGKKNAIRYCSKTLKEIGEAALPFTAPYSYECWDVEGKIYKITVSVVERVKFFCGEDRDGTLFSAYVRGTVNGVRMSGMCEYEYNTEQFSKLLEAGC